MARRASSVDRDAPGFVESFTIDKTDREPDSRHLCTNAFGAEPLGSRCIPNSFRVRPIGKSEPQ